MKLKTVATIISLSIIASTGAQAKSPENIQKTVKTIYETMSTEQLQIEVEKQSNNKTLSFALGKELIKRWTQG